MPLSVLILMLRASNRHNGISDGCWTSDEMDLGDWMAANNKRPGDDLSEFFGR